MSILNIRPWDTLNGLRISISLWASHKSNPPPRRLSLHEAHKIKLSRRLHISHIESHASILYPHSNVGQYANMHVRIIWELIAHKAFSLTHFYVWHAIKDKENVGVTSGVVRGITKYFLLILWQIFHNKWKWVKKSSTLFYKFDSRPHNHYSTLDIICDEEKYT